MGDLLVGKNSIITGARRGIGWATVETFAANGSNVWACARKPDSDFENRIHILSEKYEVDIWPLYFDVINEGEIKAAVQAIRKHELGVDILVNVAGVADESSSFHMTSLDKMRHVMDVNLYGATLITQYVSRIMVKQNCGNIINIASVAGIDGEPAQYEYVASKAAIIGATKNLSREFAKYNIRVNAIAPGIVDTEMGNQIESNLKEEILSKVMMKRMGKPKEIANVIAFLASDLSSYMTGQVVRVDGGM